MLQIPDNAYTHSGKFHADDVFSTALLQICNPKLTVERGFHVPENFDGIVYDIGDGPFDHHAKGSPCRESGTQYAAFGLLWRELGADLLGSAFEANRFDESFVAPLDLDDNTGCGNQLANLIMAYNPAWDADVSADACFAEAVAVAKDLLAHKIASIRSVLRAADEVHGALTKMKGGIVRLSRFAPWKQQLIPSRAKFVVYPSQRGGYCAQGVPAAFGSPALRVPFPAFWAGLSEAELPAASGIDGLRFCHVGRFLITATTEEDALAACRMAMELAEE
ncbi:MAG: MYG1 family protein [Ruthenibacterium sp.]